MGDALEYANTTMTLGLVQTVQGLSYERLKELNESRTDDYDGLKQEWDISQDVDWRISEIE